MADWISSFTVPADFLYLRCYPETKQWQIVGRQNVVENQVDFPHPHLSSLSTSFNSQNYRLGLKNPPAMAGWSPGMPWRHGIVLTDL
jgi:hypothetical protein